MGFHCVIANVGWLPSRVCVCVYTCAETGSGPLRKVVFCHVAATQLKIDQEQTRGAIAILPAHARQQHIMRQRRRLLGSVGD